LSRRRATAWSATTGLLAVAVLGLAACRPVAERDAGAPASGAAGLVAATLGGEVTDGFRRALRPARLRFPADHGAHPDFRSEWWYFTGNLDGADSRRYGFQLTFFRFALGPPADGAQAEASTWRSRQVWMAHFALSDPAAGRFHSFERFARGAMGLAGATPPPLRVWLEDWSVTASTDEGELFPLRLSARAGEVELDLTLEPRRPMVLQGEGGLSQKSPAPGNASYYYSYTRLAARGEVATGSRREAVQGLAWLDREWSTSALAADQTGWDWFALQLEDGRDVMLYRLRDVENGTHPSSAGVVVSASGEVQRLRAGQFRLSPVEHAAMADGERYPVAWSVAIPEHHLTLRVRAVMDRQAHTGAFRYYEGAVDVTGDGGSAGVGGRGYLEMTPYSPAPG
jgi:predicted secreted hydrolase